MGTRPLAVAASLTLFACGAGSQATVPLQVAGDPTHANVTVDDQPVGSLKMVMEHGVALPPGDHRISVEAPGYFPSIASLMRRRDRAIRCTSTSI